MRNNPALLINCVLCLAALSTPGIHEAIAQDSGVIVSVGEVSGCVGEIVEIPIVLETLADSVDGVEIELVLTRDDLAYFEVDTVVVGDDTSFVCRVDTAGTLLSGWMYVTARSIPGDGLSLRLIGISDLGSGTIPGIPEYTTGVLARLFARIRWDVPDTLTDRMVGVHIVQQATYFSNQHGELILPVITSDGSIAVEPYRRGDVNCDEMINPMDVVKLVNYVFKSMELPCCNPVGDLNCDSALNPMDVVLLVNLVYRAMQPIPC